MIRALSACLLASGALVAVAGPVSATPQEKVTICHRTNSDSNPYVLITVSANAVDGEGQNDHTHHVVDEQHARADIIPAPMADGEPYCPGADPVPGPEGPPGQNGLTPMVFCVPGSGLGFTFGEQDLSNLDGAHYLNEGEVCPLAGEDGVDGANGVPCKDGAPGPAGTDGAPGAQGPAGPAGPAGPQGAPGTSVASEEPIIDPVPVSPGELAHTGTGDVLPYLGALFVLAGASLWSFANRASICAWIKARFGL